ncbi:ABC transporter substrate-binding protein [soil metagenome]
MISKAGFRAAFSLGPAFIVAGTTLVFSAGGAFAQNCTPGIAEKLLVKPGTFTMATSATLPPMAFSDPQGNLKGLRIELGNEIAKRLCLKPEFVNIAYTAMVPGLKGGRFDMIAAGLFVTAERRKILLMLPYESLAVSISTAIGHDAGIKTIDDLAGKTLSVDIGGYDDIKLKELNEDFKKRGLAEMKINRFDNYATVYQALRAGQVEAAASIDPVAKEYQERGEFKQVLGGMFATPGSLTFDNQVVGHAVSDVMKQLKKDGFFDQLMNKYGVKPAPGDLSLLPREG